MPTQALSLVMQYRHWRAAIPTGAAISVAVALTIVDVWPEVSQSPESFSRGLRDLIELAGPVPLWILVAGMGALAGSWWCDVAAGLAARVQLACLAGIPLEDDYSTWTRWQKMRHPILPAETRRLQTAMRASSDYVDLSARDRRGAYRNVLEEAFRSPYATLADSGELDAEVVRSVTDARLLLGLFPWLPVALAALGRHVTSVQLADLSRALSWSAGAAALILLIAAARQVRAASSLAVRAAASASRLHHHARNAQLSGESARALGDARHGLADRD